MMFMQRRMQKERKPLTIQMCEGRDAPYLHQAHAAITSNGQPLMVAESAHHHRSISIELPLNSLIKLLGMQHELTL